MEFKIGKLSEETGISVDTIRYYEKQGLIEPVDRRISGYRIFNTGSIKEVEFIKRAQALGFTISEIKKLIEIDKHQDSIDDLLEVLRKKTRDLKKLLSDTSRITRALNIIEAECACSNGKSFTDLLFSDYVEEVRHSCSFNNTYLLETGEWNITGHTKSQDGEVHDLVGLSTIMHEPRIWTIRNDLVIGGQPVGAVILHVPPIVNDTEVSKYVGNCCLYGDVRGKLVLSSNIVYKYYEIPECDYTGFEHYKKLSDEVYDVNGAIINDQTTVLQWQYQLERTESGVPSS